MRYVNGNASLSSVCALIILLLLCVIICFHICAMILLSLLTSRGSWPFFCNRHFRPCSPTVWSRSTLAHPLMWEAHLLVSANQPFVQQLPGCPGVSVQVLQRHGSMAPLCLQQITATVPCACVCVCGSSRTDRGVWWLVRLCQGAEAGGAIQYLDRQWPLYLAR